VSETAVQATDFHISKITRVIIKGVLNIGSQALSPYQEQVSETSYNWQSKYGANQGIYNIIIIDP
jgi:hypothetical protein